MAQDRLPTPVAELYIFFLNKKVNLLVPHLGFEICVRMAGGATCFCALARFPLISFPSGSNFPFATPFLPCTLSVLQNSCRVSCD